MGTKVSLSDLGDVMGYGNPQGGASLSGVLQELQGLKISVCSGVATGGVGMTVSGIATDDVIIAAWELPTASPTAATLVNRTASTYVSAADEVKCNEALDNASLFFVAWFDKNP
uniref:Uncharacterized protein n=1 Tax=viral metagenome TaxID=1070528 RepID=A0A6M3K5B6_9ZZZZ